MARKNSTSIQLPPVHLVCSKDELRPALMCVFIHGKYAVATNAHVLVAHSIEGLVSQETLTALHGKLIPAKVWAELQKVRDYIQLEVDGDFLSATVGNSTTKYKLPADLRFPNYLDLINSISEFKGEPITSIAINPTLLLSAYKAMGSSGHSMNMRIKANNKAVMFANYEAIGIVMPAILESESFESDTDNRFKQFLIDVSKTPTP